MLLSVMIMSAFQSMFAGEGGTDVGGDTATKVCRFQQASTMGFLQCGGL